MEVPVEGTSYDCICYHCMRYDGTNYECMCMLRRARRGLECKYASSMDSNNNSPAKR